MIFSPVANNDLPSVQQTTAGASEGVTNMLNSDMTAGAEESDLSTPPAVTIQHPMRTRLRNNIIQPKEFTDGTFRYSEKARGFACAVSDRNPTTAMTGVSEPCNLQEAMASPDWKKAMDTEYSALLKNDTWELVPPKPGINLIDSRWIYIVKRKAVGSVDRFKARLVAKGGISRGMELIILTHIALL
jgi:hypothetical protein